MGHGFWGFKVFKGEVWFEVGILRDRSCCLLEVFLADSGEVVELSFKSCGYS